MDNISASVITEADFLTFCLNFLFSNKTNTGLAVTLWTANLVDVSLAKSMVLFLSQSWYPLYIIITSKVDLYKLRKIKNLGGN